MAEDRQEDIGRDQRREDMEPEGVTTRKCWICPTFENVW